MCEKCNDSGYISWTERINNIDYAFSKVCKCRLCRREHERQEKHIKESGLNNLFDKLTFETYKAKNEVQTYIKEQAIALADTCDSWWYISSAPGTGKTHITTAICGELIKKGIPVHYMQWRQDATKLKGTITDNREYGKHLNRLQRAKVLYIDDFFKGTVSEADKNLAFTIINERYNKRLMTLFSSERSLGEIAKIDRAIAGRIKQMAQVRAINVSSLSDMRFEQVQRL